MKSLKLLILLFFCTFLLSQTKNTITVYTDSKENKVAQFEIDIIKNVIKLMNKKTKRHNEIKFIEMKSFSAAFKYMDSNKSNALKDHSLAINKISYTKERAKKYDFTRPYMYNYYSVMTLASETELHKVKSFNAKYIYGAVVKTLFEEKVKALSKSNRIKYKTYKNVKEMFHALENGEIDFMITDYVDSWEFGLKSVFFYEDTRDRLCMLLPKGSNLKKDLDAYIKYYTKSQNFFKLTKSYFGTEAVTFFKKN